MNDDFRRGYMWGIVACAGAMLVFVTMMMWLMP